LNGCLLKSNHNYRSHSAHRIPLERLSVRQKWNLVQTLCEDISGQDTAQLEMPAWHADVLELREERIALGEASWMPIEDAIRSLEAKFA
jgi:hypothetical protein